MELETVADFRIATMAFNHKFDVPEKLCKILVRKAAERATCGDPAIEDAAGKLLLAMAKFNHELNESEKKRIDAEHARKLQLIELAAKLGLVFNDQQRDGAADSEKLSG